MVAGVWLVGKRGYPTDAGFGRHVRELWRGVDETATIGAQLSSTDVSATRDCVVPVEAGSDASMTDGVLLTGATGFVGMELLARYLERTERRVYALVRGASERDVRARLERTLVCLFGADHPYAERAVAVRGDITRPGLGLGGTRDHAGCFSEDDLNLGQRFRNAYEQSKFEAECLVTNARRRLPVTVLRPSIIVGERDSGWTQSFNVLYWPLRAFSRGAYVALPARREAPVDVVPVDYVADATGHPARSTISPMR